jgi:hypothetical protein
MILPALVSHGGTPGPKTWVADHNMPVVFSCFNKLVHLDRSTNFHHFALITIDFYSCM